MHKIDKMNANLKEAFAHIKPVCDLVMVCPTPDSIAIFTAKLAEMKVEDVQELQQYIMFPFITHLKSEEMEKKFDIQSKMVDTMKLVLDKVTVTSFEMCLKIETALLGLVFDKTRRGMVAVVPEELKLSVMRCLTSLMLHINQPVRCTMLRTSVSTIAQAVFVSVHIAKLDRFRTLRLAAIDCITAHTCTHAKLTDDKFHIPDKNLEMHAVDALSTILPGVLAALQDVANDTENPGHNVVVAAIGAIHRVLCLTMHDKYMPHRPDLTAQDFAKLFVEKSKPKVKEVIRGVEDIQRIRQNALPKRSLEWFLMAGEKITTVTRSLVTLAAHEHPEVRKEVAVLCFRLLDECNTTMQPSVAQALDILISLSNDEFPEVSEYSANAVNTFMKKNGHKTIDGLCDNFFNILNSLPRILNNIDAARKLSSLNLVHGYIHMLCAASRPQRLAAALAARSLMQSLCHALLQAAAAEPTTSLAQHADRNVLAPPPTNSPWCKLRHLDTISSETRLREILNLLGNSECSELIADQLLEMFQQQRDCEIVYTLNWMAAANESPLSLVRRLINIYIAEDVWYSPLEVGSREAPLTSDDTMDINVYNPRAWTKDSVPDLYEGTTETRLTDISYLTPRTPPHRDPNTCATLAEAQKNMVLSCLLTEGVGIMARRLKEEYQPFLMKTLCLVLERVGSKYEMLHLSGLKAINDIALACGHKNVAELIRDNTDYFTNQVTVRLKKAWNSQSALHILQVVMEYSDTSLLDCLYGIVEDVLVQSCDKYYEKNLDSYLQVFLTFIQCINKWFPPKNNEQKDGSSEEEFDICKDALDFIKKQEEAERLMASEDFARGSGLSVEQMYKEDMAKMEENILDYDDTVTQEKPPLPQHIRVTETVLKRCINFITSPWRDECLLSLQILTSGLPILKEYEDELLPLVHRTWSPLVAKFESQDPVVLRRALDLLVTMAELSKDFIRSRTVKEVLPQMYKFLHKSSLDSHLKDAGSAYRSSQAYTLQVATLTALPRLAVDLMLDYEKLSEAMACAGLYLSNKQPKPLQVLAVQFFKSMLNYDYGATWLYLRKICNNDKVLTPPVTALELKPVVGTPYESTNNDIDQNIKLIWNIE